ncbi:hypothetical protein [Desulfosporosinus sp. OT]|uniref:hypothetical protein n=1 Tax=Desulfosporosinus sp. OT TaxID=913865 RepID=UPI000223A4ED|nr:hypothetical protein [Desulfosporosinus sp. OT]EGW36494.1 hypothetical protein DOT_5658 [Desulfosporosinus sp. OT]
MGEKRAGKGPIIIKIPLAKYLRQIAKDWITPYVTKTYGGQVWISDENPGKCFADEGLNYIEFNESDIFYKLPKEVHQHIDLETGCHKSLPVILKEIKQKESSELERIDPK